MNLDVAETLARELIKEYNLEYTFVWINSKTVFGKCNWQNKLIKLSKPLVELNNEEKVKNTILHEIAHALTPEQGHGYTWKRKAAEIGCDAKRLYDSSEVVQPKGRFQLTCSHCNNTVQYFKKPRREIACLICCQKYNGGKYSEKFKLEVKQ